MKICGWLPFFLLVLIVLLLITPDKQNEENIENFSTVQKKISALVVNTTPTCLDRSDIPAEELHWLYMPLTPEELATSEYYGYLSGELIKAGVIDASECPLNGLWPSEYANSCGLEKSRQAALYLQNVYDDEILAAGNNIGVPPVMLKQLIRYESQFWPVPMGFYHYGAGHLTYLGAVNGLMWNPALYENVCSAIYNGPCLDPYFQASRQTDLVLAGQLLTLMDASCPSCEYKIDVPKAEKSITYIAQVLMGYCKQTSQIVYNATESYSSSIVDYSTIWKLTLLNYNAGPTCVYDALRASYNPENPNKMTWQLISGNVNTLACQNGVLYANNITEQYYEFTNSP